MAELCPAFSPNGLNAKHFIRKLPLAYSRQCYLTVIVCVNALKLTFPQGT